MNKLLIGLLCLSLSGCFYQSASNVDILKAIEFCAGVENVEYLAVYHTGQELVVCNDGKQEYTSSIKLPKGDESL